mgnify:CR=1 FL=1
MEYFSFHDITYNVFKSFSGDQESSRYRWMTDCVHLRHLKSTNYCTHHHSQHLCSDYKLLVVLRVPTSDFRRPTTPSLSTCHPPSALRSHNSIKPPFFIIRLVQAAPPLQPKDLSTTYVSEDLREMSAYRRTTDDGQTANNGRRPDQHHIAYQYILLQ